MNSSPPPPSDSAIDAAVAAMRERYVEASRGFLATFALIGDQLGTAPDSDDLLTSLRRELHRVRGTSGSLGFHEAGRIAGALEGVVRRWCDDPTLDRDRRAFIVRRFAESLRSAIDVARASDVSSARSLVFLGLADAVGDALVSEAMHRGFSVERVALVGDAGGRRSEPWAVIAMELEADAAADESFGAATRLLLRDDRTRDGDSGGRAAMEVIDVATAPSEIIDRLERIAERRKAPAETVLLVDDDPMMLLLLRTLAEHAGLLVQTACSGSEFREALERATPALVVLDFQLPDTDGIEILRELRADRRSRVTPVLMLSGRSDGEARQLAFEAGADDYMVKPVVPAEFQRRVAQLLELRRERRASTGLHPVTGLSLPVRTMQDLETCLRRADASGWSIATVRPPLAPQLARDVAVWQGELSRIALAIQDAGGVAGHVDETGLALAMPASPSDVEAMLRALATGVEWHSGIVAMDALAATTPRALLGAADEAYLAARDAGTVARVWNPDDVDIAPDVIVAEDDAALAEMIAFALDTKGLSHRLFSTGPEALAALLRLRVQGRPPILLLDIDLPGMDGHSLHERLRLERPGVFQVVFISLHTGEADQLRALQGGALDYLTKPFSLRVLMAKLAVWRERTRVA